MNKRHTRVLASGVFDLVHYGHIYFLKEAKRAGGRSAYLIVVVARDKTVELLKGKQPVLPEEQRRAIVESLKPVNKAVLGDEIFNMEETLKRIKPDIIAMGYDQTKIEATVRKLIAEKHLEIEVVRIGKSTYSGLESSSRIKMKIVGKMRGKYL